MTYSLFTDGTCNYLGNILFTDNTSPPTVTTTVDTSNFFKNFTIFSTLGNLEIYGNPVQSHVENMISINAGKPIYYYMSHKDDSIQCYGGRVRARAGSSDGLKVYNGNGCHVIENTATAQTYLSSNTITNLANSIISNAFIYSSNSGGIADSKTTGAPRYFAYTADNESIASLCWSLPTTASALGSPACIQYQYEFNYSGYLESPGSFFPSKDQQLVNLRSTNVGFVLNQLGLTYLDAPMNTTCGIVVGCAGIDSLPGVWDFGINLNEPHNQGINTVTDMKIYASSNYIGKVPNIRLGNGIFQLGRPIYIPENTTKSKIWVPVGLFNRRFVLVRSCCTQLNADNISTIDTTTNPVYTNLYPGYCPSARI